MGYADLLFKVNRPSDLGDWSYEVADTKLALTTRAGVVLQLCLYSDLLTTLQGTAPERMAVVKPGDPFSVEYFRVDDFLAYFTLVKRRLEDAASLQGPAGST
jgi:predicted RecB family nuclease